MANILAIRFSALGDVAMTVAVLKAFADRYPDDHITLLGRPVAAALVEGLPLNVHLRTVNLDDYKGLLGLRRLSCELMAEGYDMVADWHDVLRSKVIRFFFRSAERRVAFIDKGRRQRKMLTRRKNKLPLQLTPSPQRYADVLDALGYPTELRPYSTWKHGEADISDLEGLVGVKGGDRWVGIAPFAAHEGKIYPLGQMEKVIALLMQREDIKVFLFGSGRQERDWCERIERAHGRVLSLVGKSDLRAELRLMNNMDAMLTMDSANMHLCALAGTKTVSLWGATHPLAGFGGMQLQGSRRLQIDMDCRPCSIFGNRKCLYGDYRCMARLEPQRVAEVVINCITE